MNQFEEEIYDAPYFPGTREQVMGIKAIVKKYLSRNDCKSRLYADKDNLKQANLMVVVFFIFDECYIWIESSRQFSGQLEKAMNDYVGQILYTSSNEQVSMTPMVTRLINEGKLLLIA